MISIDKLLSLEREEISGAAEAVSQSNLAVNRFIE
jgi:hypothetical protein